MRMKTIGKVLVLATAVSGIVAVCAAQTAQKPQFEVASVRQSTTGGKNKSTKLDTSPGNLTITNVTLQSLVRWAYGSGGKTLADWQVSGGPDWTRMDLYDISAKPASAVGDRDQYRVLLQSLLIERFKLIVHREQKQSGVYTLNLGKDAPKVTPSKAESNVRSIQLIPEGLAFRNALMSEVAEFLAGLPVFDRPVLDRTGLQGRFDLTIPMMVERPQQKDQPRLNGQLPLDGVDFSSYSYGLGEIGFKLESQQAAIEIFVIDSVQRPTEK